MAVLHVYAPIVEIDSFLQPPIVHLEDGTRFEIRGKGKEKVRDLEIGDMVLLDFSNWHSGGNFALVHITRHTHPILSDMITNYKGKDIVCSPALADSS